MTSQRMATEETRPKGEGGHFLVMGYWGYAPGWGRIFRVQLTIMGSPFQDFFNRVTRVGSHFFEIKKIIY